MHASNRSDWISLPLLSFRAAAEMLGPEPSSDTSDRTTAYKYRRSHGQGHWHMGADRSIPRLGGLIQSWCRVGLDRAWLASGIADELSLGL